MAETTVLKCRALLDGEANEALSDEQIAELNDLLRTIAGVIVEVFVELDTIDQSKFYPTGYTFARADTLLNEMLGDM